MTKKITAFMLAAVMAFAMCAYAAEDTVDETVPETVQTEAATEETAEEEVTAEETSSEEETVGISGFYIANYSQASGKVNLNNIAEPDLVAAAEQAETTIFYFRADGSVAVYKDGICEEGTYKDDGSKLSITTEAGSKDYDYQTVDGLIIINDGEESSALYQFLLEDMNHISIGDYSVIEINAADVNVSDETVDNYINTILQGQTTYENITEGTTQTGDIITISYNGVLDETGEVFEGSAADGITFELGSGALVSDYEEQLTGQEIGSTVDVKVTFPEDYAGDESLIGKSATFSTTIDSKTVAETPELTDEWVQEFSARFLTEQLETVDELREFSRNYLYEYLLHTAMLNALASKTTIDGFNSNTAQMLVNYSAANLAANASYYGMDTTTYAQQFGYESADAYQQAEVMTYLNSAMIINKVLADQGVTYTMEELDSALAEYLRLSGSELTTDEYREQIGTAGIWIYTNMEFKYDLAMNLLEDRVVIKETEENDGDEETVEETAEDGEKASRAAGLLGGWTGYYAQEPSQLPEDVQEALDTASKDFQVMELVPEVFLASQVVSGTNYQILCTGTTVSDEAETGLYVVTVYKDPDGNTVIERVADFNISALEEKSDAEISTEHPDGGWSVPESVEAAELPEDAQKAFDAAVEGLTGVSYVPAALLGTKVIAGTEYAILCHATTVTAEPLSYYALVFIAANADGSYEIMNIAAIDPADYNTEITK